MSRTSRNMIRSWKIGLVATLVPAGLLAGCTTHYRSSLEAYRSAEPTPFYQRTMAWAEAQEGAADREGVAPSDPLEGMRDSFQRPVSPERPAALAGRVVGLAPETYSARAEAFQDPEVRAAALGGALDWQDIMLLVSLQSPRVIAAREEWAATLRQYDQAEFLEGLLREYASFTRVLEPEAGVSSAEKTLKSYYPNPSLTALKGEMVRQQVRLAELAWERTLRDTIARAGAVFFEYLFQVKGEQTTASNLKLVQDLVDVVQDRYATGLATQPDVLRLQAELERLRNLRQDFLAQQRASAAQLNTLLGRPADAALGKPREVDLSLPGITDKALIVEAREGRQEVREQRAKVARLEFAIRMGEVSNRPLASKGFSNLERGMAPEASTGTPGDTFGSRQGAQGTSAAYAQAESYLAEMRQRLRGTREMLRQVQLDTESLALGVHEKADIAHRQMVLIRDVLLPLVQSAYDITLRAYTVGESTFLDLLDAEQKLINTRLELDEGRWTRNLAILEVARVRGAF